MNIEALEEDHERMRKDLAKSQRQVRKQ
jgi:hypothetical protein